MGSVKQRSTAAHRQDQGNAHHLEKGFTIAASNAAHTVTCVITDTHIGSTTALCPPTFEIHTSRADETQQATYNTAQRWLWGCWGDYWDWVKRLVGIRGRSRKNRLVVVHLGDVCDGRHHGSPQVMDEIPDQLKAAVDILQPIADMADWMGICYGTDAHNGGAGAYEIAVAQQLGIEHGWDFLLDVDGLSLDCAHHGRSGFRPWTSGAAAMAVEVQVDYLRRGKQPPAYVLRGHTHTIDDSGERVEGTRAITCPSWQLRTAFGHRVAANRKRADIGGLVFDGDVLRWDHAREKAAPGQSREVKIAWT